MSDLRFTQTDNAPAAIGPYSQAVVVDGFVFCSGQIPLDPADPSGLALYGVLEARAGRVDHAAELVERALALDPDNRDARTLERQLR